MLPEDLEEMALDRLRHGNARIPTTWHTVKTYERLVKKGLAKEIDDPNPLLRVFSLPERCDHPR